jgi:hypothetical protein
MPLTTVNPSMIGQTATGASSLTATGSGDASLITAAGTALSVDSAGRVTTPFQPSFVARLSGTTSFTAGSAIVFNNVVRNVGSNYNSGTGLFTAPITGTYQFNVGLLRASGGTTYCSATPLVNGSQTGANGTLYSEPLSIYSIAGSFLFYLNANDTFGITYTTAGGSISFYGQETYLSGFLVG